jgi:S1-C subfamily serine protease
MEEQSSYGLNNRNGVIIIKAPKGGKLSQIGIHAGDVIVAINNTNRKGMGDLMDAYEIMSSHQGIVLDIIRNQQTVKTSIK